MAPIAPSLTFKGYTTFDSSTLVELDDKKAHRAVNMMGSGSIGYLESPAVYRVDRFDDQNRSGVIDDGDKMATIRIDTKTGKMIPYKAAPKGSQLLDSFTLETPVSSSHPHIGDKLPKGYQDALEELKKGNPFLVYFLDRGVLGKLDEKDIRVDAYYPPSHLLPQGRSHKPGLEGTMYVSYYITKKEIQSPLGRKVDRLFKKARSERKEVSKLKTLKSGVAEGTCRTSVKIGQGRTRMYGGDRKFSPPLTLSTKSLGSSYYTNNVPDPANPAKCHNAHVRNYSTWLQGQKVALSFGVNKGSLVPHFHSGRVLYGIASALLLKNNPLLDAAVIFNKDTPKERYGLHIDIGASPY